MASDVKWIKITTDIFDDEKILLIEALPDAYAIITCWFKLLCMAGKQNNGGVFLMCGRIAYTEQMLATIFRMKENTVSMALKTFQQFGMIEILDGVITIPNWSKHQSLDTLEARREKDRIRKSEARAKQKLLAEGKEECPETVRGQSVDFSPSPSISCSIKDNKGPGEKKEPFDYEIFRSIYNKTCTRLPDCRTITDKRKKAIKAFFKEFGLDDWQETCRRADASPFLTGINDRKWKADIDFLLRTDKAAKILEGAYDQIGNGKYNPMQPSMELGEAEIESIRRMMGQ